MWGGVNFFGRMVNEKSISIWYEFHGKGELRFDRYVRVYFNLYR